MPARRSSSGMAAAARVDEYLSTLDHPHRPAIMAIRQAILATDPAITEEIKWNAPSFRTSEHFATMNLRVKKGVAVILHFGAKKRDISSTGVEIPDPDSLLEWLAKDRAMVTFRDAADVGERKVAFTSLLKEWIRHV